MNSLHETDGNINTIGMGMTSSTPFIVEGVFPFRFQRDFRANYLNRLGIKRDNICLTKERNEEDCEPDDNDRAKFLASNARISIVEQFKVDILNPEAEKVRERNSLALEKEKLKVESTFVNKSGDFSIDFLIPSNEEIRKNYLDKLMKFGILKKEPSKKNQTIIIFDWDDTILPTSYLQYTGYIENPPEDLVDFVPLDEAATRLLQRAMTYGDTYIVTNAAEGWVEYSSKLFLPKVSELIGIRGMKIRSARTENEEKYPGEPAKWKEETFMQLKGNYDLNLITNLVAIGDSHIEMDAAQHVSKFFSHPLTKTIKFRESPRPEELIKQQELLYDKFDQIYMSLRNLTIKRAPQSNPRLIDGYFRMQFLASNDQAVGQLSKMMQKPIMTCMLIILPCTQSQSCLLYTSPSPRDQA
eukprot:TRINITY_DN5678_c0_g1_i12.p1 TRINITY_DN5678_c0_g1~~TRINITY_DN5678_c0_g1_i12.p1  ORF type:complete len:413 (-),score=31.19 TRINITY_DN5678_c0_g1_i12:43-1281(-)